MSNRRVDPSSDESPPPAKLVPTRGTLPATTNPYGDLGFYPGSAADAPQELGFQIREYLRILNKRKWLVISITLAVLALGAARTLMMTPLYTSTVRLQIDRNTTEIVKGGEITPAEDASFEFLKTQYELLQSRTMAERVASALKLGDDADFFQPREFSIIGYLKGLLQSKPPANAKDTESTDRERAAAGVILNNRAIRPVAGSRLVEISYSDPNPNGRNELPRRSPMPSLPPISINAFRQMPTPRRFLRTSSSISKYGSKSRKTSS